MGNVNNYSNAISFHHLLFLMKVIMFFNGIVIPHTKRNLTYFKKLFSGVYIYLLRNMCIRTKKSFLKIIFYTNLKSNAKNHTLISPLFY